MVVRANAIMKIFNTVISMLTILLLTFSVIGHKRIDAYNIHETSEKSNFVDNETEDFKKFMNHVLLIILNVGICFAFFFATTLQRHKTVKLSIHAKINLWLLAFVPFIQIFLI
jgi:hypothetical protein